MARGLLTKSEDVQSNGGANGVVTAESLARGQDTNGNPLVPGVFYTYNGQAYMYTTQEGGKLLDGQGGTILGPGAPGTTPTPNPNPPPQQQPFDLPWYPLTWGSGNGMYQNLREQIWDSALPRDPYQATYGRFDFGGQQSPAPYTPNTGHYNPFPAGQPRGGPPPEMPRQPAPGRDGTRGGLLSSSVTPSATGLLGEQMPSKSLINVAPPQQTPAIGASNGTWADTTFSGNEPWMQNWNALPADLRMAFARAKIDGQTNTGQQFIWQALEGAGLSPAQVEAARTQTVNDSKYGPHYRIENGALQQLQNPTAQNPAGSWNTLATLLNPTGYMPSSVGMSPYLSQLYGARQAADAAYAAQGFDPNAVGYGRGY